LVFLLIPEGLGQTTIIAEHGSGRKAKGSTQKMIAAALGGLGSARETPALAKTGLERGTRLRKRRWALGFRLQAHCLRWKNEI
jgi:hypothetical protein